MEKEKFCTKCGKKLNEDGVCSNCYKEQSYSVNGVIDRKKIKEAAKEMLSKDFWNLLKPLLISFAVGFVSGLIEGMFDQTSIYYSIISLVISLLIIPVSVGVCLYYLNYIRGKEFNVKDVFRFYDNRVLVIWLTTLLFGVFISLWTLLFIIPGIIAVFSYSQYMFLIADNKGNDPYNYLKTSKEMMKGYKMDYFSLIFSFIGWYLLVIITFGIAAIYVTPYVNLSQTLYYEELRKIREI